MSKTDSRLRQRPTFFGMKRPEIEKRHCVRCEKLFKPKNKYYFSCNKCNAYIDRESLGD